MAGTFYGLILSPKGWIDGELFKLWLEKHFVKHAVAEWPLLLLLDGHSSHCRPDTIRRPIHKPLQHQNHAQILVRSYMYGQTILQLTIISVLYCL